MARVEIVEELKEEGFIDAEGCIKINNNQAYLSIGNYDLPLLKIIKRKLEKFEIECPKIIESNTSKYVNSEGYGHNQNYFTLRINKKSILLKLFTSLHPHIKHRGKIKDFKAAKINIIDRNKRFGVRK